MDMDYFNAEKVRDSLVAWLKDWFDRNGPECKAVIGVSGGADSSVVAALCVRALGKERVLGVLMPNGVQKDIGDSITVCGSLGIKHITVNISKAYNAICSEVDVSLAEKLDWTDGLSMQTCVNLAPRLRMAALYAVSQTVKGRVINTSNLSERYSNFYTRWGDECGDAKPLANLTKTEVVEIGKTMTELPEYLVEKAPSDGLTQSSDEDILGYAYEELDELIRFGKQGLNYGKIMDRIRSGEFKRNPVPGFNPEFADHI